MFHPFELEQYMSEQEEGVTYHFAESGVHPLTLAEFLDLAGRPIDTLGDILINYPEVRGTEALRARIASLYPGANAENVLVTVGASEANQIIAQTLLAPGDTVLTLSPTYRQLVGNAKNLGATVVPVPLVEDRGWALDTEALAAVLDAKMIAVVNPHNPTGHILDDTERTALISAAQRTGAWIVADEVYAGTERGDAPETPSFWGTHDRVIVVNSMSKAYGLPGLRLGWIVAPQDMITHLWRRHEYATISATMLSMHLADMALAPETRPKLIARARRLIDRGFDQLTEGLSRLQGTFSVVPPQASAMSFVKFTLPIGSMDLALRLKAEQDLLVVPGQVFGLDDHFRFSSALPEAHLAEGLDRLNRFAADLLA
ncbi:MAG: aminotransferase class I/II-fold pyridoxal phosphate-dependent enzyme [Pseudomonadota bacterium]